MQWSQVPQLSHIGGKKIVSIEHKADYLKLQQLLKFGGVTADFDLLLVNGTRLKQLQKTSECILLQEGNTVCIAFNSCIKNSSFVQMWLDNYNTDFRPSLWTYNSAAVPKNILLSNKELCFNFHLDDTMCIPDYSETTKYWLKHNGVDWRSKVGSHYYARFFKYVDEKTLHEDHSLGDIFRYVYYA